MNILMEMNPPSSTEESASLEPTMPSEKPPRPSKFISRLLAALFVVTMSTAVCGLFAMKTNLNAAWHEALGRFRWLVLVQGDQVQVDEVGRFLQQVSGVSSVSLVTAETTLEQFSNDPDMTRGLGYINGNPFPPAWSVTWNSDLLDPAKMQESLQDVKTFPGVMDVAFDRAALESMHRFRTQWYRAKTALSILAFAAVTFTAVLLGLFFFYVDPAKLDYKSAIVDSACDWFSWAIGFVAVFYLLGPLPIGLIAVGLAVGIGRIAWMSVLEKR